MSTERDRLDIEVRRAELEKELAETRQEVDRLRLVAGNECRVHTANEKRLEADKAECEEALRQTREKLKEAEGALQRIHEAWHD